MPYRDHQSVAVGGEQAVEQCPFPEAGNQQILGRAKTGCQVPLASPIPIVPSTGRPFVKTRRDLLGGSPVKQDLEHDLHQDSNNALNRFPGGSAQLGTCRDFLLSGDLHPFATWYHWVVPPSCIKFWRT